MTTTLRQVASVACFNPAGLLLWGRRRDNGKWSMPGGHLNPGEDPAEGALRELREEAALEPAGGLEYLGSESIAGYRGGVEVHAFKCQVNGAPSAHLDPDREFASFRWTEGVPADIANHLHSPRNVTLRLLGLWGDGFEDAEHTDLPPALVYGAAHRVTWGEP